jgi:hypothetical protein
MNQPTAANLNRIDQLNHNNRQTLSPSRLSIIFGTLVMVFSSLQAQKSATWYLETGNNAVSRGQFLRSSLWGHYDWKEFQLEGGIQTDWVSYHGSILTGAALRLGRVVPIKTIPVKLQALGLFSQYSNNIRSYNWGLGAEMDRKHLFGSLGIHFRTLVLTDQSGVSNPDRGTFTLKENWNVLYRFGARLFPSDHPWNLSLAVTNIDRFAFAQETNPQLMLRAEMCIKPSWWTFLEFWPQRSGAFNLSSTYFGYYLRGGATWVFSTN